MQLTLTEQQQADVLSYHVNGEALNEMLWAYMNLIDSGDASEADMATYEVIRLALGIGKETKVQKVQA